MDKKALRIKMKKIRAALSPALRAEAARACLKNLRTLPAFLGAKTLFCYASVGDELPTDAIAAAHPRVAFPKVMGEGEMRFFLGGKLEAGYQGIPEPQGGEEVWPEAGDVMLLPGLAFGQDGSRLGYGKGFYDRYLAACPIRPHCWGLGYEEQLLDALPAAPHDQRLDLLVLPRKIVYFGEL